MYDPKKYEQFSDREIQQRILNRLEQITERVKVISLILIIFFSLGLAAIGIAVFEGFN